VRGRLRDRRVAGVLDRPVHLTAAAVALKDLCLDARDPARVVRFWADALGLTCRPHHRPGVVGVYRQGTPVLWVNPVDQPKIAKNRVHLDLEVPARERLLDLGAALLAEHDGWSVLADPEGNELCAFPTPPTGPDEPPARPFALCVDSDRPGELAAWWAARTGARPGPGPDGVPRWLHGLCWGGFEIIWKFVPVADERVAENRLHWDVLADPDRLAAAGASVSRRPARDLTWTVQHDPQGNVFCAFPPG
jgi:hypothetical protein